MHSALFGFVNLRLCRPLYRCCALSKRILNARKVFTGDPPCTPRCIRCDLGIVEFRTYSGTLGWLCDPSGLHSALDRVDLLLCGCKCLRGQSQSPLCLFFVDHRTTVECRGQSAPSSLSLTVSSGGGVHATSENIALATSRRPDRPLRVGLAPIVTRVQSAGTAAIGHPAGGAQKLAFQPRLEWAFPCIGERCDRYPRHLWRAADTLRSAIRPMVHRNRNSNRGWNAHFRASTSGTADTRDSFVRRRHAAIGHPADDAQKLAFQPRLECAIPCIGERCCRYPRLLLWAAHTPRSAIRVMVHTNRHSNRGWNAHFRASTSGTAVPEIFIAGCRHAAIGHPVGGVLELAFQRQFKSPSPCVRDGGGPYAGSSCRHLSARGDRSIQDSRKRTYLSPHCGDV